MLFNFELALIDVVLGNITQPAIINADNISIILIAIMESVHQSSLDTLSLLQQSKLLWLLLVL